MWPRRQLPVHSPISLAALWAGARAALGSGAVASAALVKLLVQRYQASAVLLTDSGTSALRLALSTAETERVPVALPAYSCYNIATAAVGASSRVLLYDLDPRSIGPDRGSLEKALAAGARVVVVAHLYGMPANMGEAREACGAHGAVLIEDAAQGGGGSWGGRLLGGFGSLSVLSFGRGKGTTGGGGGALMAHDAIGTRLVDRLRERLERSGGYRSIVGMAAQWILARPSWYGVPAAMPFLKLGETVYQEPWSPASISAASSAAVTRTISLADRELEVRRRQAARLSASVRRTPLLTLVESQPPGEPGYLRLPVLASTSSRARLDTAEGRALGVMPAYPRALAELPAFQKRLINRADELTGAASLAGDLFTLPTHSLLTEGDLERLESLIQSSGGV